MSKASNRQSMPQMAAIVDAVRAQGISVRVLFARENGKTLGKEPQYDNVFDIPANYCPSWQPITKERK